MRAGDLYHYLAYYIEFRQDQILIDLHIASHIS